MEDNQYRMTGRGRHERPFMSHADELAAQEFFKDRFPEKVLLPLEEFARKHYRLTNQQLTQLHIQVVEGLHIDKVEIRWGDQPCGTFYEDHFLKAETIPIPVDHDIYIGPTEYVNGVKMLSQKIEQMQKFDLDKQPDQIQRDLVLLPKFKQALKDLLSGKESTEALGLKF